MISLISIPTELDKLCILDEESKYLTPEETVQYVSYQHSHLYQEERSLFCMNDPKNHSNGTAKSSLPASFAEMYHEPSHKTSTYENIQKTLHLVWSTITIKAIWKPLTFIFINNILQIPNVAWMSYLQLTLKISPPIIGFMNVLGTLMALCGILCYKYYFLKISWRKIYLFTNGVSLFFSCLQLVLIFQWNFRYLHIYTNLPFILGDTVISSALLGMQYLPSCILYSKLCPEGTEGTSYAILTTFGNLSMLLGRNFGNVFAKLWDVSNLAMQEHRLDGLWKLTVTTSIIQILPIFLLFLLPRNAEEVDQIIARQERSMAFGVVFLILLVLGIGWLVFSVFYEIFHVLS